MNHLLVAISYTMYGVTGIMQVYTYDTYESQKIMAIIV